MTPTEIDRIAAATNALRPDWPIKSLRTLLSGPRLATKPRRDVAVALTWVACETATTTPARVLEAGPWWKAAAVEGMPGTVAPPRREEACLTCGRLLEACICGEQRRRPVGPANPDTKAAAVADCLAAIRDSQTREDA